MISSLLTIIGILLGMLGIQTLRRKSSEALNQQTNLEKILENDDKQIVKDQALVQAEEEKRKQLTQTNSTVQEDLDFLNKKD